jgi:hypothetical protein
VDLPPPKWVRNLKTKMQLGSLTSYRLASLSFSSACAAARHNRQHPASAQVGRRCKGKEVTDLGDVGAAGVDDLEHELLAGEEAVGHELAGAERHRR